MSSLRIKPYVPRLYLFVLILFCLNKFVLRPLVLEYDSPAFLKILVWSIPNTFEAVYGMCIVAGLLFWAQHVFRPRFDRVSDLAIYLATTVLAGTYVLTQEFKLHNLGGRNTYDPWDVVASTLGIVGMFFVIRRFGVIERVEGAG